MQDAAVEHRRRHERMGGDVVGHAASCPGGTGQRVPAAGVDPHRLQDPDAASFEAPAERLDAPPGTAVVVGVDDEHDRRRAVPDRGSQEQVDDLGEVTRVVGHVHPGMAGVVGAERQHHDGVGGLEAQHDPHHGEQVLGVAGSQGGGRGHAEDPSAAGRQRGPTEEGAVENSRRRQPGDGQRPRRWAQ